MRPAFGSLIGASAGLVVNRVRDGAAAKPTDQLPVYSLAIIGFIVGVVGLIPTLPLFMLSASNFRGAVTTGERGISLGENDEAIQMVLGSVYAVIALVALRTSQIRCTSIGGRACGSAFS